MKAKTKALIEAWAETYPEMLTMDGYDDRIVGVVERFSEPFVVYDYDKVIKKLCDQGMTFEEAREYHEFNQAGAWMGDHTVGFLHK